MLNVSSAVVDQQIDINSSTFIGVDLGGTKLHVARVKQGHIESHFRDVYDAKASYTEVLNTLIKRIEDQMTPEVAGIGVGVPSVVDPINGIVYDVANIPSWKKVYLKDYLETYFSVPVHINNDVNCFALGEYYYGGWPVTRDMVCVSLGTGMGVGLMLSGRLYQGQTCGAGELGELPYGDSKLENYCSGQFFARQVACSTKELFEKALLGDREALDVYADFGKHVAKAIKVVLLAYNPQMIVMGGSVSQAFPFFIDSLRGEMKAFPFQSLWNATRLVKSENLLAPVLGAAALCVKK